MIHVEGLEQSYGRAPVLRGVELEVGRGELVLLLGANGAGKSTLFRCLLGTVAYGGKVRVDGLDPLRDGREVRSRIGYLPQADGLQGDLTVSECARFAAELRGLPRSAGDRAVLAARLSDAADCRVDELSGGMRRRLAFALALLGDPPILLLDEPTAGLDRESREELAACLAEARRDKTILLATHLPGEHERMGGRAVCLEAGQVVPDCAVVSGDARVACACAAIAAPSTATAERHENGREERYGERTTRARGTRVIARKELHDALRHRWLHLYAGVLGVLGVVIAWYSAGDTAGLALQSYGRTAASLTNLCLLLAPLVALVMGAGAVAGERDRGTLDRLLAQPIGRAELLWGKYLGLLGSLAGATLLAFVPPAACLAFVTGSPPTLRAAVFPLVALLSILPALALGLLLSVTADAGSKALARAVLLWAWLVLLYDLLLMGTLLSAHLPAGVLVVTLLANPVHAARLLVVLALEPDLYLLGPAGAVLTEALSPARTATLLVAVLLAWSGLALGLALAAFRLGRSRRRDRAAAAPAELPLEPHPQEGIMNILRKLLARAGRRSSVRLALLFLLLAPAAAQLGCKAGEAGGDVEHAKATDRDHDDDVRRVDAALLDHGHTVYVQNCAPCHGETGKGDGTAAASLDPKPRDHTNRAYMDTLTDASIAEVVKVGGALRGFPNMPSHPHIGGDDMVALVAYVRSLSRGVEGVRVVDLDVD
jgi:ABC-type multidrug transport system ATPase subunit/ABC-type transport system involved in multi-copper enzyme maturation permease subunit/mono/diheme cytochrome c family protein